jgi:hypothetical protein
MLKIEFSKANVKVLRYERTVSSSAPVHATQDGGCLPEELAATVSADLPPEWHYRQHLQHLAELLARLSKGRA